jgi:hypothetical protein
MMKIRVTKLAYAQMMNLQGLRGADSYTTMIEGGIPWCEYKFSTVIMSAGLSKSSSREITPAGLSKSS